MQEHFGIRTPKNDTMLVVASCVHNSSNGRLLQGAARLAICRTAWRAQSTSTGVPSTSRLVLGQPSAEHHPHLMKPGECKQVVALELVHQLHAVIDSAQFSRVKERRRRSLLPVMRLLKLLWCLVL